MLAEKCFNRQHNEGKGNYKLKQLNLCMQTLVVQPKNKEQLTALKAKEQPYNPEFVTKMARAEDDINAGRITKIEPAKIWDYNN